MDVEETKLCPNCKHQISATNFSLHTVHCQRSLTLCTKCDEAIPRTAIKEHMESAHKEVPCSLCRVRVESCRLENHQSESCSKRLIKCEYCEVECHAGELQEHEDYCGSRTELCDICGQYILIKDEAVHIASGHAPKDRNRNKQDNVLTSKEAVESALKNAVHTNRPKVPNIDRDIAARQSPTKRSNDMPQINSQTSLNTEKDSEKSGISDSQSKREALDQLLALHLAGSLEDIEAADIPFLLQNDPSLRDNDELQSLLHSTQPSFSPGYEPDILWDYDTDGFETDPERSTQHLPVQSITSNSDASELIPCEFCGELCSMDYLVLHESGCRPDLAHGSLKEELNNVQSSIHSHNTGFPFDTSSAENLGREPSSRHATIPVTSEEVVMLPCEICSEHYPYELLMEHQALCPAKEDFSNIRLDLPEADRNFATSPLFVPTSRNNESSDTVIQEDDFSHMTSDDDRIPCEFCGDHFPSDVIIEHQNFCSNFQEAGEVDNADVVDVPNSQEQSNQKENVPACSPVQNGIFDRVEKPNTFKSIDTDREIHHRPTMQHVKFGPLPASNSHRQPRSISSTPTLTHHPLPRVCNVPISVASDYNHHSNTYARNRPNYLKSSKDNVAPYTGASFNKSSPAINSYERETRKALNPVKEALRQETARQNMRNSGTGTRPKNQTTRDHTAFGVNRQDHQADTNFSRYAHDAKHRETEPTIPSYLRSSSGKLEEAFKTFLASKNGPSRIGQYRRTVPMPQQRTIAQASGDRLPTAEHDTTGRLPPILGMGAVPKKKESRKTSDG